ncbi:cephalosporin deacetylase [Oceanobacillus zhaokaii]|uniref:Cephalosporin deacetylase n=1 Tax=Oceanobacillus zhaokaii TaxID=2052660 RepID=A0A345PKL9_9BACI|nr:cephalosporin deacetylase [Oceanobacillus zhaokaii]
MALSLNGLKNFTNEVSTLGRQVGDFPLEELRNYRPNLGNKPDDFDAFWAEQKMKMNGYHPHVKIVWRDYAVPSVEVADITFTSWDNTPLTGILVKPKGVEKCQVILSFHGYTGNRGLAADFLKWTTLGIAVFAFDVRGQGESPDFSNYRNGSRIPGWMLLGIQDHENYYYTNVYRDILLQLNWLQSEDSPVGPTKLGVMGSSQGGGLALVAAGLEKNIDFCIADWPFIAHFERALDIALSGPYMEIVNYFKWNDPEYKTYDKVIKTLGYIDSVHFCDWITCPTLMAIGLEDATTPSSTVFAAFNHLKAKDKTIEVYPQFMHEFNPFHEEKKVEFLMKQLEM